MTRGQTITAFGVRIFACIFAAAAVIGTANAADDYDLPSIGQPADTVMSPAEEERIGRQVVSQLHANGMILEDPELTHYVNEIGTRLARSTQQSPSDFHFYVIDDDSVNAFALPGGYIGVNAGLLLESENESELAGVLAHEIAHVTQRHIARQIQATQGMSMATAAAMLLAIIAGGGNPAVVQAAVTMGVANIGQQQINFTRAHELEADRLGIQTLAEAGYNPNGMVSFFEKMQRRSRLYGNRLPEILLTHPVSTTRIAEARARARDYQPEHVRESEQYPVMRARARVLASTQPSEAIQHFEDQRSNDNAGPAAEYGYALALMRVGRVESAHEILARLHEQKLIEPHAALALAEAQKAENQPEAALATLAALKADYPSYRPVVLAYADTLVSNGQPQAARDYLIDQEALLDRDPQVHELLARASSNLKRLPDAYYQQAKAHRLRGEFAAAIHKLKSGLQLEDLSEVDKSRLRSALNQYRSQCHEAWSQRECRERVEGVTR